ncbi:MAG: radical SAM protein [Thermoplasmata archaeon]|nr:MAG: radical SAM protein [Thermoplasmata archaeon]
MFLKLHLADLEGAKKVMPRYFRILDGEEVASFLKSKRYPIAIDFGSPEDVLWEEHDKIIKSQGRASELTENPQSSLLDLKLKLSRHMLASCDLCERRCEANRLKGKKGHCGVLQSKISSEFVHWGEEPELVPSHTIFFSGCTFNCVFCQNWDISQNPKGGNVMSPRRVAEIIERRSETTKNTNWVGGDPTSNLPFILECLTYSNVNTPQVWNSNMYVTEKTMRLLDGIIDVYLTDFKYGNDECAKRLSNATNYWEIVTRNHKMARAQCEMIIRHLVLPGHFKCCTKPILTWISENLKNVRVNVMDQYRPEYNAYEHEELTRKLHKNEFAAAFDLAQDLGLSITD